MKILVDNVIFTPSARAVVKGVRGIESFYVVEVKGAHVVAIESAKGESVYITGDSKQVFVRSPEADVVLNGTFTEVEIWGRDVYLMGANVSKSKIREIGALVVQNSIVRDMDVLSDNLSHMILFASQLVGGLFRLGGVSYSLWAGTRTHPLKLEGGRYHMGEVLKWWLSGSQIWDGGMVLDVEDIRRLVVMGRIELGSVSVPEDVEWSLSRRDYHKELAEVVEILRGGDENEHKG